MNKGDVIDAVAQATGLTKKTSGKALDAAIAAIDGGLKKRQSVTIVGFGSFRVVPQKERVGRNPRTGEPVRIDAANAVRFVPGKALKEAVR